MSWKLGKQPVALILVALEASLAKESKNVPIAVVPANVSERTAKASLQSAGLQEFALIELRPPVCARLVKLDFGTAVCTRDTRHRTLIPARVPHSVLDNGCMPPIWLYFIIEKKIVAFCTVLLGAAQP